MDGPYGVRIPADVERPDRILAGLTARQLGIVAAAAVGLWVLFTVTRDVLPLPVFAVLAFPVIAGTGALILLERDGMGLDRLLLAAIRHLRAAKRLVPGSAEVIPTPEWIAADSGPLPAPLRLPAQAIAASGVIDLGGDGAAVLCVCSTVNFGLRTVEEQHGLVAAFGRWLNSLDGPVQLVVRSDRVDVTPLIEELEQAAGGLPHPALEQAALEHAAFLADLAQTRDLLRRQVLLVIREPTGPTGRDVAGRRALRRAEQAARDLAAAGIRLAVLDGAAAAAVLTAACDPSAPPRPAGLAAPDAVITAAPFEPEE